MTHPSKRKGNEYERELVNQAKDAGLAAERAYASNGEALGHHATVDLVIAGNRIQAKRVARFLEGMRALVYAADYEHVDAIAMREDGGETIVVMTLWEYFDLIRPGATMSVRIANLKDAWQKERAYRKEIEEQLQRALEGDPPDCRKQG